MWKSRISVPVVLCFLLSEFGSALSAECSINLSPGETVKSEYPGYHGFLQIHRPAAAPGRAGYPVIFWYHGYSRNLRPNTRITRAVTGGKIFIIVGMDYATEKFYEDLEPIALDEEVQKFHAVLQALQDCVPIDREHLIMAGYSQGGYATTLIGERVIDELAGLVVLGAGRSQGGRNLPAETAMEGMPIFIGIGENDSVHRETAEATAKVYALLGATVSIEHWPDTTHIDGWRRYLEDVRNTAGLRSWLNDVLAN